METSFYLYIKQPAHCPLTSVSLTDWNHHHHRSEWSTLTYACGDCSSGRSWCHCFAGAGGGISHILPLSLLYRIHFIWRVCVHPSLDLHWMESGFQNLFHSKWSGPLIKAKTTPDPHTFYSNLVIFSFKFEFCPAPAESIAHDLSSRWSLISTWRSCRLSLPRGVGRCLS